MNLKDAITWADNASACSEALAALDAIDVQAELEGVDAWDMLINWDDAIDVAMWLRWFTKNTYGSNKIIGAHLMTAYAEFIAKSDEIERCGLSAREHTAAVSVARKTWFRSAATILRMAPPLLI